MNMYTKYEPVYKINKNFQLPAAKIFNFPNR